MGRRGEQRSAEEDIESGHSPALQLQLNHGVGDDKHDSDDEEKAEDSVFYDDGDGKKSNLSSETKDCRICQLSLESSGVAMVLGCCCKNDLAAAHKHCAQTWFQIRGNKICEICGSTAHNVVGLTETEVIEQQQEANISAAAVAAPTTSEARRFWQGHRFLNFLLACLVFAFVISWLFHFNVPG